MFAKKSATAILILDFEHSTSTQGGIRGEEQWG